MISDWFRKPIGEAKSRQPEEAQAEAIFRALSGICPMCGEALRGHSYQLFAITVADESTEILVEFIQSARGHSWETLSHFQTFDPMKNALEAFALGCPDTILALLLVRDPFELYDTSSVEYFEALNQKESATWRCLFATNNWRGFGTAALAG